MKYNFLVFALFLVLLIGCAEQQATPEQQKIKVTMENSQSEAAQGNNIQEQQKTEEKPEQRQEDSIKEFSITAKRFEFRPSTIAVNKGDKVILHLTSSDVTHGFAINAYDLRATIIPGKTTDLEFIADKTGEFTFYCSFFCGFGHSGMNGKLVVR